jgi:cell division protein FtsW
VKVPTTTLFFCVVAMLALGMVMLFSASVAHVHGKYFMMQPIWCGIGLVVCWLVAVGDYRWLKRHPSIPWGLLLVAVALLVLVLKSGLGVTRNGATRWLALGKLSVQPSEFAKLGLIIALAYYGDRYHKRMRSFWWGLLVPGLITAPVLVLIFKEPDWGTTVLLAAIAGIMLYVAGARSYILAIPAIAGLCALLVLIWNDPVRLDRWLAFLHPEEYKDGAGYQTYQAMVAIGSGGLTGLGLGDGRQKLGFVPENHTDFIFSVIGEEFGLVATMLLANGYLAIVLAAICIAWRAQDTFGMLLSAGITSLIGLQAAINIGVVTGSLPNKGLALPFISYGGSNLVLMLGCVGLLLNVARHAADHAPLLRKSVQSEEPALPQTA